MTTSAQAAKAGDTGRYKRSVRNYLIDSRFQLKYTGLIVLATLIVSIALFTFLWRTSTEVVVESAKVTEQSKNVSNVVKMGMEKNYPDDPELQKMFNDEAAKQDQQIQAQQDRIARQQSVMIGSIGGALGLMVALIGLLGIYFTHKVAGPIFKMKRLLGQVGEGKLVFEGRLRKGDELQDFFEAFASMVEKLRARRARDVAELDRAIEIAKASGADADSIARVALVRDEMKRSLEG